jgi:hypothetical protein
MHHATLQAVLQAALPAQLCPPRPPMSRHIEPNIPSHSIQHFTTLNLTSHHVEPNSPSHEPKLTSHHVNLPRAPEFKAGKLKQVTYKYGFPQYNAPAKDAAKQLG